MPTKKEKRRANNIETRLEDSKREYDFKQTIIERLLASIDSNELIVMNGNNTESASPSLRIFMDITKSQLQLRKQINEMEILIQDGKGRTEEETNPFE